MISIGARFLLLSTFCFALSSFAAGPIMELYPRHVTFLTDFDDNTVSSRVGDLVCQTTSSGYALADTGLFGSTGLKTGGFQYMLPEGQTVLDMTKSGTVLFWLKMDTRPDPVVKNNVSNEPTATHFSVNWNTPRDYINRT